MVSLEVIGKRLGRYNQSLKDRAFDIAEHTTTERTPDTIFEARKRALHIRERNAIDWLTNRGG